MYKSRPAGRPKGRTAHKEPPLNPSNLDGGPGNENSQPTEPLNDPADKPSTQDNIAEPFLFENFVLIVTNANRVKKQLNEEKQN